jgi:hypothetical protein
MYLYCGQHFAGKRFYFILTSSIPTKTEVTSSFSLIALKEIQKLLSGIMHEDGIKACIYVKKIQEHCWHSN